MATPMARHRQKKEREGFRARNIWLRDLPEGEATRQVCLQGGQITDRKRLHGIKAAWILLPSLARWNEMEKSKIPVLKRKLIQIYDKDGKPEGEPTKQFVVEWVELSEKQKEEIAKNRQMMLDELEEGE